MQSDFSSANSADNDKEFDSAHVSMDLAHGHQFQKPTDEPAHEPPREPAPAPASMPAAAAPPPLQQVTSNSHKWWMIGGIVGAVLLLIPVVFFVFFYDDGGQEREDEIVQVDEEPQTEPEEEPTPGPEPEPESEPEPTPEPPVVTVDTLETEDQQPTVTGTVNDSAAGVEVSVGGRTYTAAVNGSGDWRATVSGELEPGVYDVTATADNGETATDQTADELEITQPPEPVEEPDQSEKESEK